MNMRATRLQRLGLLVLAGCGPEVPAQPSFQQDVMPILAANCIRCHGFPAIGGAPRELRLDSFGDTVVTDGVPGSGACGGDPSDPDAEVVICGAATYAAAIPSRLRDETRPMPPRFPLDDDQIAILENWTRDPIRGEPRPGNAVPTIEVLAVDREGSAVRVRTRVDDVDGDLVTGTLRADLGAVDRFVGSLRSGTIELVWDVSGVAAGAYPLTAEVDDGAQLHVLALGTITVEEP